MELVYFRNLRRNGDRYYELSIPKTVAESMIKKSRRIKIIVKESFLELHPA